MDRQGERVAHADVRHPARSVRGVYHRQPKRAARLMERAAPHPGRSGGPEDVRDRKSTRLNSSHSQISYAVFCLKKKKKVIRHNELKHTRVFTLMNRVYKGLRVMLLSKT